ncbi:MAG: YheC/YheD family protein, partial [Clostridium sp.]|nr:YheC/YheD family protein [Clostridium sp.]
MLINKLKIKYLNSNNVLTCYLTDNHISNLGLNSESDYMIISAGSITLRLKKIIVKSDELNPKILYLSEDLKNLIYIPEGTVFQIKTLSSDRLELGPIIGIFIPEEDINNLIRGKIINSYTHFTFTCKNLNGLCCFFSTGNIDFINNTVKGIVRQNSKWILSTFPLPKVIYDQNHKINSRMYSIDLREKLGEQYKVLNAMAKLEKWETLRVLGKFPKLAEFIPKTIQYKSIQDLENSLRDNSSVYLKPNSLSKGKGIFRVVKISEAKYRVEYRTNEENHVATLNSLYDINKLLFQYFFIGKGYIIQQEIKKALFRGKAFDLRVLYQKDYQGEWQPSGISTRISALGSIITSPRSGGTV